MHISQLFLLSCALATQASALVARTSPAPHLLSFDTKEVISPQLKQVDGLVAIDLRAAEDEEIYGTNGTISKRTPV